MTHLSVSEFRNATAETINRVAYGGERITLGRRGNPIAALISMEDLKLLRALEDRADLMAMKKAKEEPGEDIPYEQVRQELGL